MKIEYIRARNFLSIGDEPLEIDFTKLSNIVLVDGRNLDYDQEPDADGIYHSNGAGKSTLIDCVSYSLYGNTIRKRVTHTEAIHNKTKKRLEVEIIFKMGDTRYRIVRTRKPDTLRFWQDGPPWIDQPASNSNEKTMGGQPTTQAEIEKVIKMNHKAFINVVYFGQHNSHNFLECTADEQRQIAESLLSLEDFKNYCKQAKEDTKEIKLEIKQLNAIYEQVLSTENRTVEQIEQLKRKKIEWEKSCLNEISIYEQRLKSTETQLSTTDTGTALLKYEQAQAEINELKEGSPKKTENEASLENALNQAKNGCDKVREKIHECNLNLRSTQQELNSRLKDKKDDENSITRLKELPEGAQCPHCYSKIDKQHYKHVLLLHQNRLGTLEPKISLLRTKIQQIQAETERYQKSLDQLEQLKNTIISKSRNLANDISRTKMRINELLKIQQPNLSANEVVLQERITQIQKNIANKKQELSSGGPYVEILSNAESDLVEIRNQKETRRNKLTELNDTLPYYEWWVDGFDDIRSFIIERILPALNSRIAMWMDYLVNGKVKVTFDKHLNASMESSNGDPYSYFAMCGSEKRRIDLAISQAFGYIMMLSSGTWPSLVFLDEVSDSICQRGVQDVYKMICELANEKQVFVVTHNSNLRKLLDGVDTITMVRENGRSRIEK